MGTEREDAYKQLTSLVNNREIDISFELLTWAQVKGLAEDWNDPDAIRNILNQKN